MNLKHNGKVQASFKGVMNPLELPKKKIPCSGYRNETSDEDWVHEKELKNRH